MIKINRFKILAVLILSGVILMPSNIVRGEKLYNVSESDLIKILEKYENENVMLEDGLILTLGEALDLQINDGWTVYNSNVADIVDGELQPKAVGSTFITQENEDGVYIMEVCITAEEIAMMAMARSSKTAVNRDYYKVFIDPGHGGVDNGAVQNGVYEDEINLQVSKKIETLLKAKGVVVEMSRYDDTYLSLTDRTNMANKSDTDIFVSIHQNSATTTSAKGIETYYSSTRADSKALATDVQNKLIDATSATDRGIKTANFTVIKTANMPSNLVECGFISNVDEAKLLSSESYQNKVAEGIVNGIVKYLNENIILSNGATIPESGSGSSGSSETIMTGTVKVSNSLNVRSGAGSSYSVIGSLSNGATVDIVEESGSWYKIKYGTGFGYVSKDYVTASAINGDNGSTDSNSGSGNTSGSGDGSSTQTGTVKVSNSLNVRSGAGSNYSVIGSLSNGAKVEIVETSGNWYKIKYGSGYGYVSKDYVTVTTTSTGGSSSDSNSGNTSGSGTTTTTQTGTIKVSSSLNVRSGAGSSYSVIGSLSNGATVEIVETSGSWYKIKYGSGYGYVSKDYVTVTTTSTGGSSSDSNSGNTSGSGTTTTTQTGTIKVSSSLNVRSGAGSSYSVIGSLSNGAKVEIVETSGSWYKIKYGSGYGYVSKDYVTVSSGSTSGSGSTTTTEQTGTVKANGGLNVRSGAGSNHSVIGSLANGASVTIVETSGSWYKIKYGSGYGYVSADYITVSSRSVASADVLREGTSMSLALKVREESNFGSDIIGTIAMGNKVSVVEDLGEWSLVLYGRSKGYILNEYVDFNIV